MKVIILLWGNIWSAAYNCIFPFSWMNIMNNELDVNCFASWSEQYICSFLLVFINFWVGEYNQRNVCSFFDTRVQLHQWLCLKEIKGHIRRTVCLLSIMTLGNMCWKNLVAAFKSRKQGKAGDRAVARINSCWNFFFRLSFEPELDFLLFCSSV